MDSKGIAIVLALVYFFFNIQAPSISSISPNNGINNNLVNVVVVGTKFDKNAAVKLVKPGEEDIVASDVKVISDNKISCSFNLKNSNIGKWDVVVTNKKIRSSTLTEGFMIEYPAPSINAVNPRQNYNNSVATIEIRGSSFRTGALVMLSSKQMDIGATNVNLLSDSRITCELNLNQADPGVYNVKVINDDGKAGILANGFTVADLPKPVINVVKPGIDMIDPKKGFNNGMILTGITGQNFDQGSSVKLSRDGQDIPGLNIKVENPSKITCFFDIAGKPVGQYDVEVIDSKGQKAILASGFTVENFVPNSLELNKALKAIYFDLNKAEVRANQAPILSVDCDILKANPKLYILLGGHADERGSIEYNLELSARRANIIKKYLLERGIDPKRITIYAYGKEFPLVKGHNESSWQRNRRVDIMVWEEPPAREKGIISGK